MVLPKDSKGQSGKSKVKPKKLSVPPPASLVSTKWVILQLTPTGEREKNIQAIIKSVRQILNRQDIEVFIPAISQKVRDESLTTWFSDGYVFARYVESVNYSKLQETTYFSMVLCKNQVVNGVRKIVYSLLDDCDLNIMRKGMKDLKIGEFHTEQEVKIVKGHYKNLTGKISAVYEGSENVQVYINLRSKKVFMDFPSSYLQKIE